MNKITISAIERELWDNRHDFGIIEPDDFDNIRDFIKEKLSQLLDSIPCESGKMPFDEGYSQKDEGRNELYLEIRQWKESVKQ